MKQKHVRVSEWFHVLIDVSLSADGPGEQGRDRALRWNPRQDPAYTDNGCVGVWASVCVCVCVSVCTRCCCYAERVLRRVCNEQKTGCARSCSWSTHEDSHTASSALLLSSLLSLTPWFPFLSLSFVVVSSFPPLLLLSSPLLSSHSVSLPLLSQHISPPVLSPADICLMPHSVTRGQPSL